MRTKPLILIIDDLESNLQAVGNTLQSEGFDIALAYNGKKGIEVAKKIIPDLILLDLIMPEIDGYEVCTILKQDESTKEIPIIFLTSMKNHENIIKGFDVGAVDYIIKPAHKKETLARVKTHLELKKAKDQLKESNEKLEKIIEEKNHYITYSSKEIMSPINEIKGINNFITKLNTDVIRNNELMAYSKKIDLSIRGVTNLINNLLYLHEIEQENIKSVEDTFAVQLVISAVAKTFEKDLKAKRIPFELENYVGRNTYIFADKQKIEKIFENLISNSIKFSDFYKAIKIKSSEYELEEKKYILVEIIDNGIGMSEELINRVFEKFSNFNSKEPGNDSSGGLGLPIVKKLVDEMNGKIWIESIETKGTKVSVLFPSL